MYVQWFLPFAVNSNRSRTMKTRTTSLLIAVAACVVLPWQAHAGFTLVENFNSRTVGALGGQNGWVVTAGDTTTSTVVVDPDISINKVLKHTGTNDAHKVLPAPIPNAASGTLFYRVRLISTSNDVSAGLSDENPPSLTNFGTFEVQPNYSGSFRARDAGTNRTVFTMVAGAWYKLWAVIDTTADTYRLYLQSDGDPAYATQTELVSSDGTWNFRNAAAANPLQAFVIMSNSGSTNLYFDDLYVDTAASNLDDPTYVANPDTDADGMNDAWEVFYFTDLSHDGTGDFDADGVTDLAEYTANTFPNDADSDDDGLTDGQETTGSANSAFASAPTNPMDADSDDDGTSDGQECNGTLNAAFGNAATDPNVVDTDGDNWSDSLEFTYATNPNDGTNVPVVHELIGLVKRNGSFEYRDGVVNTTNFKQGWDGSGAANDIDAWSTWTEQTTTSTDSGVETGNATHGTMKGFCQSGNGAKNMTTYRAKAGDIISLTYDRVNGYTTGNTYLIMDASSLGLGFLQIPNSPAQTLTGNGHYNLTFKVPAGNLAIGLPIGVGIKSTGSWPGWDSVILTVQDADADADGLSDFWEDQYFGNNDGNPTSEEIALQDNTGDPDGDGYNNGQEEAAGSDPGNIASTPDDMDGDGLADAWEVANFGSIAAQVGSGDPDHDFASNELEETAASDPNNSSAWPDSDADSLNDAWEIAFFTNLDTGNGDSDSDGFDNLAEMAAGSDPTDAAWTPERARLAHRWSFNGDLLDSAGGSPATIVEVGANDATLGATGVTLTGGDKAASDYVSLGTNLLQGKMAPVTIELWATPLGVQNYGRIFDFGKDTNENLFMAWTNGTNTASDRVGWKDGSELLSDGTNAPYALGTEYHIVMTLVPSVNTGGELATGTRVNWYSAPAGTGNPLWSRQGSFDVPHHLVTFADVNDWLGRSQYGDATANATFNEVRMWDGVLTETEREIFHVAGPDTVSLADTDGDGLVDSWELAFFGDLAETSAGDPDNDGAINLDEQAAHSNPVAPASVPGDVDADNLNDAWETTNFGDLAQTGAGDFDGDFNTNEAEETAGTDPKLASSWPDTDSDTLNDGWEEHYFGNADGIVTPAELVLQGTDGDPDADTFTNLAEQTAGTDPTNAFSSPDTDFDGLADGWELYYFGDLDEIGSGDPDGDGSTNRAEIAAGTNPALDTSVPDTNGDGLADGFVLVANDAGGASSFNSGLNWDGTLAPAAGANYLVPGPLSLRSPDVAADYTFAGDRLVLAQVGTDRSNLTWKNNGKLTIPFLGLDGGVVNQASANGSTVTLDGAVHVTKPSDLWANNGSITVGAAISGTAQLNLTGGNTVTLNGASTLTGNINATATMVLGNAGSLKFVPTTAGATNAITGTGAVTLAGTFAIDLGAASTTLGDNWLLVASSGTKTYGATFAVGGFTADAGAPGARKWTSANEAYEFDEATGLLSVIGSNDSDSDTLPDEWEMASFGNLGQTATGDPDADGTSNRAEFLLGLDPTDGTQAFRATQSAVVPGSSVTLAWPAQDGLTFKVWRSPTLADGSWLEVGSLTATGTTATFTDLAAPAGRAFYRIELVTP